MRESEASSTQADFEALKALEADVSELGRIESLLDRFNIFEAIGFVGQEVKHSRFLAFLLDPKQNHGLGDLFLKSFLWKVSEPTGRVSLPTALGSADDGSLGQTRVQTEVYTGDGRIDILLLNEAGKWAMVIENKVWSAEHSNQLDKYYRFVKKTYPGLQPLGCYLTPFGSLPSGEEDRENYQSLGYGAVCEIVDSILENGDSTLSADVRMALEHYAQMLRRNIVGDSELARLCSQIYWRHHRALDVIYAHRFVRQETTRKTLLKIVEENPSSIYNSSFTKYPQDYVTFWWREWDTDSLKVDDTNRWTGTGRVLLFVFGNFPDSLDLILQIGPGDEETRYRLLRMAHNNPTVFKEAPETLNDFVTTIFARPMLTPDFYEDASDSEREHEIGKQWDTFLAEDLPRIEEALKKETWIWESVEHVEGQSSQGSRFVWGEGDIQITKWPEHED